GGPRSGHSGAVGPRPAGYVAGYRLHRSNARRFPARGRGVRETITDVRKPQPFAEGMNWSVLNVLESKFQPIPQDIILAIRSLRDSDQVDAWLRAALLAESLDDFRQATNCWPVRQQALQGWNVIQSQQVLEWMAEGEAKGEVKGKVGTLLRVL